MLCEVTLDAMTSTSQSLLVNSVVRDACSEHIITTFYRTRLNGLMAIENNRSFLISCVRHHIWRFD